MLNFKAAVTKATTNIAAVYELRNVLKTDVYHNAFGDNANEVLIFNTTMGVASWVQLGLDIKNKRGMKRIVGNQVLASIVVLGHNAYFSKDVREAVRDYLNK